jgi:hypothetical protein
MQPASAVVLRMIQGLHISHALHVAAELGIADLLANGPRSSENLAELTKAHAPLSTACDPIRRIQTVAMQRNDTHCRYGTAFSR